MPAIHVGANVWVMRSSDGSIHLALEHANPTSSNIRLANAVIVNGQNYDRTGESSLEQCVVAEFIPSIDERIIAKIADHVVEICDNDCAHGDDLVQSILTFRATVEAASTTWTFQRLVGLWGS